jgi:hypothetical protein
MGALQEPYVVLITTIFIVSLPTFMGWAFVRWLLAAEDINGLTKLGLGFYVGHLLMTFIMRLMGAPVSETDGPILVGSMLLLTVFFIYCTKNRRPTKDQKVAPVHQYPGWAFALLICVGILVLVKQSLILNEVVVRPLWSWDAIDSWVQRSQEWFLRSPGNQFIVDVDEGRWYEGPWRERIGTYPHPFTTSLISLWGMTLLGGYQVPAANIAWAFAPLALGLLATGFLLDNKVSRPLAIVGGYLVFSIPYASTHASLPGYAELWLTGYFTSTVMLVGGALQRNSLRMLIVAIVAAIGILTTKRLGILVTMFLFVSALVFWSVKSRDIIHSIRYFFNHIGKARSMGILFTLLSATVATFLLTDVKLGSAINSIVGKINLDQPNNIIEPLVESLFYQTNWNISLVLFTLCFLFGLLRLLTNNRKAIFNIGDIMQLFVTLTISAALVSVFTLNETYYMQAQNMTTLNRSFFMVLPILIIQCVKFFDRASS